MPTENRSSNTEMVNVPRDLLERLDLGKNTATALAALPELRALLAQPAEQHQDEPVALPERKGTHLHYDTLMPTFSKGWNACLDEIAKLGPLYPRPVQGEPVVSQCALCCQAHEHVAVGRVCGKQANGCDVDFTTWRCEGCGGSWSGDLDDPGEVERLHKGHIKSLEALNEQTEKQRDHWMAECKKRDAQLAERDALLDRVVDHANFWHDHPYAEVVEAIAKDYKAISAIAEPSAPVERDERASFEYHHRVCDLVRDEDCPEDYRNQSVQDSWEGWQARAALERKPS